MCLIRLNMIKFYLINNWKNIISICGIAFLLLVLYQSNNTLKDLPGGNVCTDNSLQTAGKSNSYFFEVMGQIKNPGVYEMNKKMLVIEAIEYAGGFVEKADLTFVHKFLSLASEVKSAQKIYIPAIGEEYALNGVNSSDTSINSGSVKINLNTSNQTSLMTISGVGEVTANKIIELRPIKSFDDLKKLSGVPQKTIANIIAKTDL